MTQGSTLNIIFAHTCVHAFMCLSVVGLWMCIHVYAHTCRPKDNTRCFFYHYLFLFIYLFLQRGQRLPLNLEFPVSAASLRDPSFLPMFLPAHPDTWLLICTILPDVFLVAWDLNSAPCFFVAITLLIEPSTCPCDTCFKVTLTI